MGTLVTEGQKVCTKCHQEISILNFYRDSRRSDGRCSCCRSCILKQNKEWAKRNPEKVAQYHRTWRKTHPETVNRLTRRGTIKRSCGLTVEQFEHKLESQSGRCLICGSLEYSSGKSSLCVDHDHKTKLFRGLICDRCNRGLGLLGDSEVLLLRALRYLQAADSMEMLEPLERELREGGV
jgi:hypothetical protein